MAVTDIGYNLNTVEPALQIFTDGGCSGNPGPGGWAYVIIGNGERGVGSKEPEEGEACILAEKWGAEENTTNNRMELTAVIASLRALKALNNDFQCADCRKTTVYTDSQYVQKGITEWISKWKRNSWRTVDKKPVKNKDLWVELDSLAGGCSLEWKWIRGHSGIDYNERCDRMTQEAIASIRD